LWKRFSDFGKVPIPDGARPAIRRFLNAWFRSLKKRPRGPTDLTMVSGWNRNFGREEGPCTTPIRTRPIFNSEFLFSRAGRGAICAVRRSFRPRSALHRYIPRWNSLS
jgi:hypothetical protein